MSNDAPYVSVWEKWYFQSKATEMCEFCAKIPAFYGHLQLAATLTTWFTDIYQEKTIT